MRRLWSGDEIGVLIRGIDGGRDGVAAEEPCTTRANTSDVANQVRTVRKDI